MATSGADGCAGSCKAPACGGQEPYSTNLHQSSDLRDTQYLSDEGAAVVAFHTAIEDKLADSAVQVLSACQAHHMAATELNRELVYAAVTHPSVFARLLVQCPVLNLPTAALLGCLCCCQLGDAAYTALLQALKRRQASAELCTDEHLAMIWLALQGSAHWSSLPSLHGALARLMAWPLAQLPAFTQLNAHNAKPGEHGVGFCARMMASVEREEQFLGCLRALHWLVSSPVLPLSARASTPTSAAPENGLAAHSHYALLQWLKHVRRQAAWGGVRGCYASPTSAGGGYPGRRTMVLHRRKARSEAKAFR